jgi:hypothetical protein
LRGRRELVAILLLFIIAVALVATIYYVRTGSPTTRTSEESPIPVGAFLYLWYGDATTATGGLGSPGWNSTSCPGGGAVVDTPSAGYYASDSNATFERQVSEMQSAGITFAVVSWWGPFTSGEAGSINMAALDLFRFLKASNSSFKVALMVDAFTTACGLPSISMGQVYDYVWNTFAAPFNSWYFRWEGKPLLLLFNPLQPRPNSNFTVRTIGNRPNPVSWVFWDAPANFSYGQGGTGVNITNDIGNPYISSDGEVTIVPRIDSYFNYLSRYQSGYLRFDPSLQLGLYRYEWEYLSNHRSEVNLVLIYSWNEYHERTAIEPHEDATSTALDNDLLNITRTFACYCQANLSLRL